MPKKLSSEHFLTIWALLFGISLTNSGLLIVNAMQWQKMTENLQIKTFQKAKITLEINKKSCWPVSTNNATLCSTIRAQIPPKCISRLFPERLPRQLTQFYKCWPPPGLHYCTAELY
jgi:hypothetical protein